MRYVAFLRAINVGGHVVKMDVLREIFESLALTNVSTFIASGNVIFESKSKAPALEKKIEGALEKKLGYAVGTFIRTIDEIAAVIAADPFPSTDGATLYVGFLKGPASEVAAAALVARKDAGSELAFNNRELYWLLRMPLNELKLTGAIMERELAAPVTLRNVSTLQKIVAKFG